MKKFRISILFSLLLLLAVIILPVQSASHDPGEMITYINDLRLNSGISILEEESSLTQAAQDQADYLASVYGAEIAGVDDFHHRPDGTDEFDRAVTAGYAVAPGWYVDEVAYGDDQASTTLDAFNFWRGSTQHLNALLNKDNVHIGAAVTVGDDFAYYVVVFGIDYSSGSGQASGVASTLPTAAITQEVAPVSVAEASEDGSISHEVQAGETLWGIALAYEVTADQIIALNNLSEDGTIYQGAVLLIQPAYTPTPEPTVTRTAPPPTRTPVPARTAQAANTPVPTRDDGQGSNGLFGLDNQNMGLALILVSGIGLVLIVVGMLAKGKASRQDKSE